MSETKTVKKEGKNGTGDYAELLALSFFQKAVRNYADRRRIDSDMFEPLVRNLGDSAAIFSLRDQLLGVPYDAGEPGEDDVRGH